MESVISDDQFGLLVERHRSLSEYREHAPDRATLLTSYANFLQRRFPAATPGDECVDCGRISQAVREFTWRTIFHTNKSAIWNAIGFIGVLGGHGWTNYNYVDASTHHALCASCGRSLLMRRVTGAFIEKICFALLLITIGILVLFGLLGVVLLFRHPSVQELMRFGKWLFLGVFGLWVAIAGTKFSQNWPVPSRLRKFIKAPFRLR